MATKKKKPPKNKPARNDADTQVVEPESTDGDTESIGDLVAALGDTPEGDGEGDGEGEAPAGSAAEDSGEDAEQQAGAEGESEQAEAKDDKSKVELVSELPIDADDDLTDVEGEASPRLVSIVESLLFSSSKPLKVKQIRKVLSDPTVRQVQLALKHLLADTAERGIVVSQVAGGFMLRTNPDNATYVQKLLQKRPVRLSRPQLETMAIIAYRQPITRAEIDHVRGVDSGGTLKVLLERDLIKIVGRREEVGRPMLYGTTVHFLEFFNLQSLRDLPDLREFRELSVETKERLKKDMNETEVEALGQEVLAFSQAEQAQPETAEGEAGALGEGGEGEGEGAEGEDQPREDGDEAVAAQGEDAERAEGDEAPQAEGEDAEPVEGDEAAPASEDAPEAPESADDGQDDATSPENDD